MIHFLMLKHNTVSTTQSSYLKSVSSIFESDPAKFLLNDYWEPWVGIYNTPNNVQKQPLIVFFKTFAPKL